MTDSSPSGADGESDDDTAARPASWGPTDSFNSLVPVIAFVALNSLAGLKWAIVGTTVGSLYAMHNRYRRGLGIGVFVPVVAMVLVARAVIGIITDSEDVYFGSGIALKFLIAIGLVVSVVVNRNAVGRLAPYAIEFPAATLRHDLYRSTTAGLTLMWAAFLLLTGGFDVWLLRASSANGFVIIRFLVSWPLSMGGTMGAMLWANQRMSQIPGFPGLVTLLESQIEAAAANRRA